MTTESAEVPPVRIGVRAHARGEASAEPPGTLVRRLRTALRTRHDSRRSEEAYVACAGRYAGYHGLQHPRELGAGALQQFPSWLAVRGQVSAATQNRARSALAFLRRTVQRRRRTRRAGER